MKHISDEKKEKQEKLQNTIANNKYRILKIKNEKKKCYCFYFKYP